jgi:4-diphosphocytidyl-2-C-methyl-D-erythritol kinase
MSLRTGQNTTVGRVPVSVRVRVPAKVNLHLGVGPLRPDGFHEVVTVFHAVDLCDDVVATPCDGLSVSVTGEEAAGVPVDRRNLAWQAAALVAEHAGVEPNVRLEIAKAVPVAGGMAGGSADGAAALVACAELWGVPRAELPGLAALLGSDVAFPLVGGTALGTGRGEVLAPVPTTTPLHWVFALADGGISTAAAYRELDRQRGVGEALQPAASADAMLEALRSGSPRAVAAALTNDLQPASLALAPALRRTLDAGGAVGALAGIVSGSGPTCAFLCPDPHAAVRIAAALAAAGVCRSTRVATGPAPGAAVD